MTTDLARRREGTRYELSLNDQSWWELGWDPALGTYFAQRWHADRDVEVSSWHGAAPGELGDLDAVETVIGCPIPADIRAELEADRAAAALRQGQST